MKKAVLQGEERKSESQDGKTLAFGKQRRTLAIAWQNACFDYLALDDLMVLLFVSKTVSEETTSYMKTLRTLLVDFDALELVRPAHILPVAAQIVLKHTRSLAHFHI